jgi:predicted outer membrane repeat protein
MRIFLITCVALFALQPDPGDAATVRACSHTQQTGAGLNLSDAVKSAYQIDFECPPGTVIRVDRPLDLNRDVRIDGRGMVTLDAGRSGRVFIGRAAARRVELVGLKISNATRPPDALYTAASAVDVPGELELRNVEVLGSDAPVKAQTVGVIDSRFAYNSGVVIRATALRISGAKVLFEDNTGAPFSLHEASETGTADIASVEFLRNGDHSTWAGTLRIVDSVFIGNHTTTDGGALHVVGDLTIEGSRFHSNQAAGSGGALFARAGRMTMRRCEFGENVAAVGGGAASFVRSTEDRSPLQVEIRYSNFQHNSAATGGAISVAATLTDKLVIRSAVIKANAARGAADVQGVGGGLSLGGGVRGDLRRVLLLDNVALSDGAALYQSHAVRSGRILLANSIVARNRNQGSVKGALSVTNSDLVHTTVTRNDLGLALVPVPQMFGHGARLFFGLVTLKNSLIVANDAGNCRLFPFNMRIEASAANLQFPTAECSEVIRQEDPKLDDFFIASPGSPARGAGEPRVCNEPPVESIDLLGERRRMNETCTLGAIEGTFEKQAMRRLANFRSPEELPVLLRGLHDLLVARSGMPQPTLPPQSDR